MKKRINSEQIRIEPWSDGDLDLLQRMNIPEMWKHLGGPESEEKVQKRHKTFFELAGKGTGRMFKIVYVPEQIGIGSIGYWEREWRDETVYEMGWFILPSYQGNGYATEAGAATILRAKMERKHQSMHAYPPITNPASNAICRKLGFEFVGEHDFEFPVGHFMRCNDWRLDFTTIAIDNETNV